MDTRKITLTVVFLTDRNSCPKLINIEISMKKSVTNAIVNKSKELQVGILKIIH